MEIVAEDVREYDVEETACPIHIDKDFGELLSLKGHFYEMRHVKANVPGEEAAGECLSVESHGLLLADELGYFVAESAE